MKNSTVTKYGYGITSDLPFAEGVKRVKEIFAEEGFGALWEIDVQAKMKEKLDKDMEEYVILGMCNPALAYEALQQEYELGLLLPCNVIVYRKDGNTRVSVVNPIALLGIAGNRKLDVAAKQVDAKMKSALHRI